MSEYARSRRGRRAPGSFQIESDWVRVVRVDGDRITPVSGAKPENRARIHMRMLAHRQPDVEFKLSPVVQEVPQ